LGRHRLNAPDNEDIRPRELAHQYPRWRIWHGPVTDEYGTMPPRDHPTRRHLISHRGLDQLARRLATIESQHDLDP
jgi:hypothetical protein